MKILLTALIVFASITAAFCQDDDMEKLMSLARPNENHGRLEAFAGQWKLNILSFDSPDGTAGVGKSNNKIVLGGRFLEIDAIESVSGATVNVRQFIGYDNQKEKYFLAELNDLTTGIAVSEGSYDKGSNTITFSGVNRDPRKKEDVAYKIVLKLERENKYTYDVFVENNHKFFKTMTMSCIKTGD